MHNSIVFIILYYIMCKYHVLNILHHAMPHKPLLDSEQRPCLSHVTSCLVYVTGTENANPLILVLNITQQNVLQTNV